MSISLAGGQSVGSQLMINLAPANVNQQHCCLPLIKAEIGALIRIKFLFFRGFVSLIEINAVGRKRPDNCHIRLTHLLQPDPTLPPMAAGPREQPPFFVRRESGRA
jgi:hypothetical protein